MNNNIRRDIPFLNESVIIIRGPSFYCSGMCQSNFIAPTAFQVTRGLSPADSDYFFRRKVSGRRVVVGTGLPSAFAGVNLAWRAAFSAAASRAG